MDAKIELQTGPQVVADGGVANMRGERSGAGVIQQLHARLHETNFRLGLFAFGISSTALAAANAIATGVTATAQPVIGLWNPATSPVNLVIVKTIVNVTVVANSMVNPAGFMWLVSNGQAGITTGSTPFNCKTLAQSGSFAKAFAMATALTGLSGSLSVFRPLAVGTVNAAGNATAVSLATGPMVEETDGSIIVPPGGVAVVMNQISTTTLSVNSGIVWEEIPV